MQTVRGVSWRGSSKEIGWSEKVKRRSDKEIKKL